MAKVKLTKSAVDAAQPQDKAIELRDTVVPGFLCKLTPAGRKVFMLQYRTNAGERRPSRSKWRRGLVCRSDTNTRHTSTSTRSVSGSAD